MPPPSLLPTPVVAWQDADLLPFLVLLKAYGTHALGLTGMHTLGGRGGGGGSGSMLMLEHYHYYPYTTIFSFRVCCWGHRSVACSLLVVGMLCGVSCLLQE